MSRKYDVPVSFTVCVKANSPEEAKRKVAKLMAASAVKITIDETAVSA